MAKILIIDGHPNKDSFNAALAQAYTKGGKESIAEIKTITTPGFYYWFAFGRPSVNQLKKSTLEFCGIKPVRVPNIGPIRNSNLESRKKMLQKVEQLGSKNT